MNSFAGDVVTKNITVYIIEVNKVRPIQNNNFVSLLLKRVVIVNKF
jgi:hypothetical protein